MKPGSTPSRGTLCVTAVIALVALVDLWALSVFSANPVPLAVALDAGHVRPELEKAFYGDLDLERIRRAVPFPWVLSDRSIAELQLYEAGARLGPSRALHDEIRKLGAGRYDCDHVHTLRFSASDSTDPRTNGRQYLVSFPLFSRSWLAWFLVGMSITASCAAAVVLTRGLSRSRRASLIRLAIGMLVLVPLVVLLRADVLGAVNKQAPRLLFFVAVVGALASLARLLPVATLRRLLCAYHRRAARLLLRWGLPVSLGLCVAAVVSTWRGSPVTDFIYPAFLGHLPYSDAGGYLSGAQALVDQGALDEWNCRRPLNASLLAVRIGLGGGEYGALILQALLLGFSMYLASRAVSVVAGIWSGVGFTAVVLAYAHTYVASTLSESLGISFGCLSLSLLVIGVRERRLSVTAMGVLALSMALNARAGAMFMLPCVIVAAICLLCRSWRRVGLAGVVFAGVAACGFVTTHALVSIYGKSSEGAVNANFSHTILGLAKDANWSVADEGIEDLLEGRSAREKAEIRYAKAWELIAEDPQPFLSALRRATEQFTATFHPTFLHGIAGSDISRSERNRNALLALIYGGLAVFLFRERKRTTAIWVASWSGVWLSAPLIYIDGGWRVFAPAIPFLAGIFVLGFGGRSAGLLGGPGIDGSRGVRGSAASLTVLLIVAALGGPLIVHAIAPEPPPDLRKQPPDTILVSADISAVLVAEPGDHAELGLPTVSPGTYRRTLAAYGQTDHDALLHLEAPFVVLKVYDYASPWHAYGGEWVIGRPEDLRQTGGYMLLRIEQLGDTRVHRIVEPLSVLSMVDEQS